ncbi:MAG: histidine triad nucleotide-binding protein [Myxococcota bacterium]|nr:histidine triad nucleotide-binding protein [Myxococcota bacterium]
MTTCLFCDIAAGTTRAQIILENEHIVAFRDIRPVAPTHALVVPKKHIAGVHDATPANAAMLGQLLLSARDAAEKLGLGDGGYRLVINQGADAGQSVAHLHCHVLGGRPMQWPPG